jgi:hypothetical protein
MPCLSLEKLKGIEYLNKQFPREKANMDVFIQYVEEKEYRIEKTAITSFISKHYFTEVDMNWFVSLFSQEEGLLFCYIKVNSRCYILLKDDIFLISDILEYYPVHSFPPCSREKETFYHPLELIPIHISF